MVIQYTAQELVLLCSILHIKSALDATAEDV